VDPAHRGTADIDGIDRAAERGHVDVAYPALLEPVAAELVVGVPAPAAAEVPLGTDDGPIDRGRAVAHTEFAHAFVVEHAAEIEAADTGVLHLLADRGRQERVADGDLDR